MTDQMGGATFIEQAPEPEPEPQIEKNNIGTDKMEFSSSINDVMSAPIDAPPQQTNTDDIFVPTKSSNKSSGYPLNLTKAQFESLVAGVSAMIAVSGPVQDKLGDIVPSFFSDLGKITTTGLLITGLVTAVLFYFIRQFMIGRR